MTFSTVSPDSTGGGIVRGDGKRDESGTTSAETQRMRKVFESAQQSAPSASAPATVRVVPLMPGRTPVTSFVKDGKVTIGTFSFTLEVPFAENQGIIQVLSEMNKEVLGTLCTELQKKSQEMKKWLSGHLSWQGKTDLYAPNLEVAQAWYRRRFKPVELLQEYQHGGGVSLRKLLSKSYDVRVTHFPKSEIDMDWLATNPSTRDDFLACFDETIAELEKVEGLVLTPLVDEQETEKDRQAEKLSVESFRGKLTERDDATLDANFSLILQHGTPKQLEELDRLFEQAYKEIGRNPCPPLDKKYYEYARWKLLRTNLEGGVKDWCSSTSFVFESVRGFFSDPVMIYARRYASDESRKLLRESFRALRAVVQENKAHFEGLKQPRLF